MRLTVNKKVLRRARAIVKKNANKPVAAPAPNPLPVVAFLYPRHGKGKVTERIVRVAEMNDTHLKGFEIRNERDNKPGTPKTYLIEKVSLRLVSLLHF